MASFLILANRQSFSSFKLLKAMFWSEYQG